MAVDPTNDWVTITNPAAGLTSRVLRMSLSAWTMRGWTVVDDDPQPADAVDTQAPAAAPVSPVSEPQQAPADPQDATAAPVPPSA